MQSPSATAPSRPAIGARTPIAAQPRWLCWLPLLLSVGLLGFLGLPRVQANAHLSWAFAGVGGAMVAWQIVLWWLHRRAGRALQVEAVPPVRQHYIQACVQLCLYLYWGWHWQQDGIRPIYAQAPLIVAQALFVYAFDALLAWSRGSRVAPRVGPDADRHEHEPVHLVPRRLVRVPVRDGRGGSARQGVREVAARRPPHAHLQPVGVRPRGPPRPC
jgi:hypothetical protein